jgi:regulation of enolase protein 1 (concanavalin A-like superfamily)
VSGTTRRSFVTQSLATAAAVRLISSPTPLISSQEISRPGAGLIGKMKWMNEPAAAHISGGVITVRSRAKTDFWRETYTGNTADNGHFFHLPISGDFMFTARVAGKFSDQFDQAGIMVRLDAENWMKCGTEFFGGKRCGSVVFTRDFSDWSVMDDLSQTGPVWWRAERKGNSLQVYRSLDGKGFSMIRSGYFMPGPGVEVGIMCAAPEGNGFESEFDNLWLSP